MNNKRPLVVADTSLLVSILLNEQKDRRVDRSEAVLGGNEREHNVVLPSIVELELYAQSKLRHAHSLEVETRREASDKVTQFLRGYNCLTGELDRRVVEFARALISDCNIKAADAAVVATGLAYGAAAVYTWDEKLIKACAGLSATRVMKPPDLVPLDPKYPHLFELDEVPDSDGMP